MGLSGKQLEGRQGVRVEVNDGRDCLIHDWRRLHMTNLFKLQEIKVCMNHQEEDKAHIDQRMLHAMGLNFGLGEA